MFPNTLGILEHFRIQAPRLVGVWGLTLLFWRLKLTSNNSVSQSRWRGWYWAPSPQRGLRGSPADPAHPSHHVPCSPGARAQEACSYFGIKGIKQIWAMHAQSV
uniref:Uncharacterized protein n=1 Tax=Mus musculus TaxID=10090 RepID=Q8C090_MOUSE|nr:unnamed protein product [Mus musculus]